MEKACDENTSCLEVQPGDYIVCKNNLNREGANPHSHLIPILNVTIRDHFRVVPNTPKKTNNRAPKKGAIFFCQIG